MSSTKWTFCSVFFFLLLQCCSSNEDTYKEELYIRPLSTGHTYFNLLFTTVVSPDILQSNIIHHYHLFPKVIADLVRSNGVSEFHVSLTQGLWRYDRWGMPIVGAPPGAEVWAWFKPNEQKDVAHRWTSFVHELGGLLCASLNFVDSNVSSSSPHYSFRPQSTLPVEKTSKLDNSLLRYAVLPREIVCTENLTPWKKLLPCVTGGSNHKGLAGLLDNAPKLHHSAYHSIRMDLRQICANAECTSTQLELSMALAIVVDTATSKPNYNEWTFRSIFGSNVAQSCPLSSLTNIYVDLQISSTHKFNISPEPDSSLKQGTTPIIIYDLNHEKRKGSTFSMSCNYNKQEVSSIENQIDQSSSSPPIVVHRYATGYGVRDGGITTVIKLNDEEQITLLYFEQIPWYFRVFLHTLKITTLDDQRTEIKPDHISYIPGKDRERSYQLELVFQTKQSISISFEFEMAFLKWNEFPPDPNHGFYIPSAVISTYMPSKSTHILRSLNSFALNQRMSSTITYPSIRRDPSVTDSYGNKSSSAVTINDPYRWLEDPDSEETSDFVSKQNLISQDYINKIPYRTKFFEHLKEIFNIPKFSCPSKQANGKYYYFMNTGLQNQDVYYELDSLSKSTDQSQVLLDPNTFSKDGTVAIQSLNFSFDGKTLCYSVSDAGSDWSTIYFMDVPSRQKLDDVIIRTKFSSLNWTTDNRGIFYTSYAGALDNITSSNESATSADKEKSTETVIEVTRTDIQEVYFRRLGTPRSSDICVARCTDDLSEHFFSVQTSDDGQYLIASITKGTLRENKVWVLPLSKLSDSIVEQPNWIKLIDNLDFVYNFETSQDDLLYFKTNAQAENCRLITINIKTNEIREIINEDKENLLEDITRVYENYFVVRYLSHVKSILYLYDMQSGRQLRKFDLPIGTISVWGDQHESEIFIRLESFLSPTTIYMCNLAESLDASLTLFKRIEFQGVDLNTLTTEQVFVDSNGLDPSKPVKVPMFLVHRKDLQKNSQNPTNIYVYGGFSTAMKPFFSIAALLWIYHFDGIFAVANVRGGAEYGETWHRDGYKSKKVNTFLDLCTCTEWLISNKYTRPEKISIMGGSNGGLTVATCANMRPDLFACVIVQVGVLDLYRYHKFTIGYYWCGEYGNPDLPEEFEWVKSISPLHNIPKDPKTYPAILITTADHDDRVVPGHSFKYIAQLQHQLSETMNRLGRPLIIRIDVRAGHGAGKPTVKRIEELSETYSFIANALDAQWHD